MIQPSDLSDDELMAYVREHGLAPEPRIIAKDERTGLGGCRNPANPLVRTISSVTHGMQLMSSLRFPVVIHYSAQDFHIESPAEYLQTLMAVFMVDSPKVTVR